MPSLSRFIFVISCYCFVLLTTGRTTDPKEVDALLAIKKSLVDPTNRLKDWKDGDPCRSNWTGVICFDAIGTDGYLHVGELLLMKKNLAGNLAPELGKLSALEILDFMWNNLTGPIPKEIGQLSSLRLLLLNGNKLSGSLPPELGSLSNLDRFQIDENNISGPVPTSYANLSSLKHLHFNNNSISGQVPAELSKLPKLIHVLLDNNNLSGILPPQLSDVPGLLIVQLDNNNFTGSDIPASYGNFSRLLKLSLRNCGLQGTIPDFSMSPQLKYLDLSRNSLTGAIPSTKLSDTITTIDLSGNNLNGSIPETYSDFPSLQKLSLANNFLSGPIPAGIWQNMSFTKNARLLVDLRNNLFSDIPQDLNTPKNVTLRLGGNPVCSKTNTVSIDHICKLDDKDETPTKSNSTKNCPVQSCPLDDFYEYVPESPLPCFCASPLRIGYRLKSPSFSYFPPLINQFQEYIARELHLDLYQLSIDSYDWEGGPRLRMYLKLFPNIGGHKHSNKFNASEVLRIRDIFTSWSFNGSDIFGPYELLNFTLVGPYDHGISMTHRTGISDNIMVAITGGAVAVAVLLSVIATLLFLKNHTKRHRQNSRGRLSSRISMNLEGVRDFTYKELAKSTDNFSSSAIIGRGGYGKVYKGTLCDKTVVAIKRAEEGSLQGQKEFLNEIKLLSRLHHRNLVSLVGYCDEEDEQMLVYEFMPNGTLRDWLSAKTKTLNFNMRLSVALGSAKGLLYLHTEANPPVFHRDVKATNILLDSKLNAKVADFGLSRLAPFLEDEGNVPNYVSTVVRGTPGYLDPEYFLTNKLTDKSDVYSLGVVFLELLTGMHPIMHGKNIVREVNVAFQSGLMFSIIDNKIGPYTSECVERFAALALNCCQDYPEKRPYMTDVVRELENIQKTLQEIEGSSLSEFASLVSGKSFSSSSSYTTRDQSSCTTRDQAVSLNIMGSDLISGVIPSISPR